MAIEPMLCCATCSDEVSVPKSCMIICFFNKVVERFDFQSEKVCQPQRSWILFLYFETVSHSFFLNIWISYTYIYQIQSYVTWAASSSPTWGALDSSTFLSFWYNNVSYCSNFSSVWIIFRVAFLEKAREKNFHRRGIKRRDARTICCSRSMKFF